MDKILLSTFFALLAGFITAAVSFVKLVNDKEGRISDHRQEWTNSARDALANLISKISTLSDYLSQRSDLSERCNKLSLDIAKTKDEGEKNRLQGALDYQKNMLEAVTKSIMETRKELHEAYSLSRLHFKLNDPLFLSVERITESIISQLKLVDDGKDGNKVAAASEISSLSKELITVCRGLLKAEWEKIKEGEPVYKMTKIASKWIGVIFFFILISFGVHAMVTRDLITTAPNIEDKQPNCTCESPKEKISSCNVGSLDRLVSLLLERRESTFVCNNYLSSAENRGVCTKKPKLMEPCQTYSENKDQTPKAP